MFLGLLILAIAVLHGQSDAFAIRDQLQRVISGRKFLCRVNLGRGMIEAALKKARELLP